MIGNPDANKILIVDGLVTLGVLVGCQTPTQTIWAAVLCLCAIAVHLYLNKISNERKFWGNVSDHYFVIDWGPYGPDIADKIPE
ncbi:MAG: hypothetical protein KDD04_09800, partial [Sinomicrobium sp.]|nr:hypothetical protein [Sinomicrobium sp.]